MPDVIATEHENVLLGDVCGVVGDALQVLCHPDRPEAGSNLACMLRHSTGHHRDDGCASLIHLVVTSKHAVGLIGVFSDERVKRQVEHVERSGGHQAQFVDHQKPHFTVLFDRAFGDVDRLIADALKVRDEPQSRRKESQVAGDGLPKGKDPKDQRVNLKLVSVDLSIEGTHFPHNPGRSLAKAAERDPNDSFASGTHSEKVGA
ncbi:MAG TPA: hypothetical protein VGX46_14385 [Vicinamibacterales bacterium]|nr:hypothetical protein [Vicinamibacterales bacterium]